MEISDEQIKELKGQIIRHINSSFPEERKNSAIESVNLMDKNEFIEFLKKNNLINVKENGKKEINSGENPFRLIVEGKVPSYILDENKDSLAVLEIRPASKAHTIIIPKNPVLNSKKIPKSAFSLAKKISKRIKEKLNTKEVLISESSILGEFIINILPIYSDETLSSPRSQASKEELESLKEILEKKKKKKIIKKPKIKKIENPKIWLPKRIP